MKLLDFKTQWGGDIYLSLVKYYKLGHRYFFVDMNYPDNISAVEAVVELRKVLKDVKLSVVISDISYGDYYKELIVSANEFNHKYATELKVRLFEQNYFLYIGREKIRIKD